MRVPFPKEDGSLTPYTFELGYGLMTLVYDTLLQRDGRGAPRPLLARSVRREGRVVTVRLRADARWHDGRRVTSADVAYSYGLFARRPHPRFTAQLRDIAAVQAPDDATVVLRLRRASLGVLEQPLADVPIVPRHLWRGLPAGRAAPPGLPVGSGPFRLVEHRVGRSYRFRANADWYRGRPRVSELRVPIVPTFEAAVRGLRRRTLDALPFTPLAGDRASLTGGGLRELTGPSFTGTVLAFNTAAPPFDDVRVRRAVSRALDLDRLVAGLGRGAAIGADRGYLHPDSGWAGGVLQRYAPEAARLALAESALPRLTVVVPESDALGLRAAREVVRALARVGVGARVRPLPIEQVVRSVGGGRTPPSFQLVIANAPALASRDPAFLRVLFGRPPEGLSRTGYTSAAFERAADHIDAAGSPRVRRRAVARILEVLARDVPVVPLYFARSAFPYRATSYDGWRLARGGELLEKWSFVGERSASPPAGRVLGPAAADPLDDLADSGSGVPGWLLGGGGAALVLILVAAGWRARRPAR